MNSADIIHYWFVELRPRQWFVADPQLDRTLRGRFEPVHRAATRCELASWRSTASGRLAEVIVLDQFSRNLGRGSAAAFAHDALALALAQEAVRAGADQELPAVQKAFLYMPYMHSESRLIHEEAVRLFHQPGLEDNYGFELRHKAIIDRFGRYPHRNAALNRSSTAEEIEYLAKNPSPF